MNKLIVYMLEHLHEFDDGHEDLKLIGHYSTREKAEAALALVRDKPGFRDNPEGFTIWEIEVDKEGEPGWPEGFHIVVPGKPETY
jgi:hypothetical protein